MDKTTRWSWRMLVPLGVLTVIIGLVAWFIVGASIPGTVWSEPLYQPKTPHTVAGREDCLSCHGSGSVRPVGVSHTGRTNGTCLGCHPLAGGGPTPESKATPTPASQPASSPAKDPCLICHERQGLTMRFPNGEELSVSVDQELLRQSVHGNKLTCLACHRDKSGYPHARLNVGSRREYSLSQYEACKSCHFANYTRTLDSVHYKIMAEGDSRAPVCTDCHGYHDVTHLYIYGKGATISRTCAKCHGPIYDQYATSVHGKALTEGNRDVPDCTDCHGVHDIRDPRTRAFHVESYEICARCHTNKEIMDKYGISTNVLKTYLQDFHGVTVSFYEKRTPTDASVKATCIDCHGIHDIKATDDPESSVIRANLVNTCRKCHPDASENFPAAWLKHYEPSPTKSPIVYYVKLFYKIFIPLTVGGLMLHIGLDFWKLMLERWRGRS